MFNLETILIREGLIDEPNSDLSISDITVKPPLRYRVVDKRFLLFLLVLFDNVSSVTKTKYNLDRIIDTGLIDRYSYINWNFALIDDKTIGINPASEKLPILDNYENSYYSSLAIDFMEQHQKEIINFLSIQDSHANLERQPTNHIYDRFNRELANIYFHQWIREKSVDEVGEPHTPNSIKLTRSNIKYGLKISSLKNTAFYDSTFTSKIPSNKDISIIKDVSALINIDLSSLFLSFPIPNSMSDVLYLRSQHEIIIFREVFFHWCDLIRSGHVDICREVFKDIDTAKKGLEKFDKWEKRSVNILSCSIEAAIGQIPYLSNLLSIYSPFTLRKTIIDKNKYSWLSLFRPTF